MTTSTVNEARAATVFKVGDLYTNGFIIVLCTEVRRQSFVGVIVHRYASCPDRDCYFGAIDEFQVCGESQFYFRKFQGEVTLSSR